MLPMSVVAELTFGSAGFTIVVSIDKMEKIMQAIISSKYQATLLKWYYKARLQK